VQEIKKDGPTPIQFEDAEGMDTEEISSTTVPDTAATTTSQKPQGQDMEVDSTSGPAPEVGDQEMG